jgi:hypothetical protein
MSSPVQQDFMIMPEHILAPQQADSAINLFDPPVVHIDFLLYTSMC